MSLAHARVEGLGLSDDFLLILSDRARAGSVVNAASYDLPAKQPVEEAIQDAWDEARRAWAKTRQYGGDPWNVWLIPLLKTLNLLPQKTAPLQAEGRSYPVSHLDVIPVHYAPPVAGAPADLDRVQAQLHASPHGLIQGYLNAEPKYLWGMVTNGERLRLLRNNVQVTRPAFVEFDLAAMMESEDSLAFRVFWLLLHRTRLDGGADAPLEAWNTQAQSEGVKARDGLRDGVALALEHFGTGFLTRNPALQDQLSNGELTPTDLYRAALKLVYQLVFLFVTEDRDLLLERGADNRVDTTLRNRFQHYGTRRLRDRAATLDGSGQHSDVYEGLKLLLSHATKGFAPLGIPALGGHLFEPQLFQAPEIRLSNHDLYQAIRALSQLRDGRLTRPVNYAGLDSEELGSIYESLLELVPRIEPGPRFVLSVVGGNERKTTGSYYTPSALIELLLESALDPVIAEAAEGQDGKGKPKEEAIAALKALKVIDPACGSGHFLIAAARRIGLKLAQVTEGVLQPSPPALREATRTVIAHCIYGVDINPMAAELARVALWLEGQQPGKPLAFLDHRLKVGNSLLGTTPELMRREDTLPEKVVKKVLQRAVSAVTLHLPDDAFVVLEGDDKAVVNAAKKQNKAEREAAVLAARGKQGFDFGPSGDLAGITKMVQALDRIEPDSLPNVQAQEATYQAIQQHAELLRRRRLADAWCAAFVIPRSAGNPSLTTATLHAMEANPASHPALRVEVERLARRYRFFHSFLEFPDVAERGGFDCVLGNPPWERIKLQEKEWFAARVPEIAQATNAAARIRLIAKLKIEHPTLHAEFLADLRQAEGESHLLRSSGRYPLTGRGDVNTYALFSETCRDVLNPAGRMGIIVPTGIATDDTTKFFFASVVNSRSLYSLLSFHEIRDYFIATDSRNPFCLLTITGAIVKIPEAVYVFSAKTLFDVHDPAKRFSLAPEDIALLNPNTRTAPIFRSRRDATITKGIYQRVPVLMNEEMGENPWGIKFMAMFHMSSDSDLFRTAAQLQKEGWTLEGNRYRQKEALMRPLYEAKLLHQFDHRFATYMPSGDTRDLTPAEKADSTHLPQPRYWVKEGEVEDRLIQKDKDGRMTWTWARDWLMGFRDIARSTDVRTTICSVISRVGAGNTMPFVFPEKAGELFPALLSGMSSFVLDYSARQKVGGTHLTYSYIRQFPVLPPSAFTPEHLAFITPRVLELTYTAGDLSGFAADLSYTGPPFTWNDERRFWLRAELDALYFMLYGIGREDVEHIMDTFPIVRRKDEAANSGKYVTKDAILSVYDELKALGLERLSTYVGRLERHQPTDATAPIIISPAIRNPWFAQAVQTLADQYPTLRDFSVQEEIFSGTAARSEQNNDAFWSRVIIQYLL